MICLGCLKTSQFRYCSTCQKSVFAKKRFKSDDDDAFYIEKNHDTAVNKHAALTVAQQVFALEIVPHALVPASSDQAVFWHIARRFPLDQLRDPNPTTPLRDAKTLKSYLDVAQCLRNMVAAYPINIEVFFKRVLLNFLICHNDASVNQFRLTKTDFGDYLLSPIFDLKCLRVNALRDDTMRFPLTNELSASFRKYGFYTGSDFLDFGKAIGIKETRVIKIIRHYIGLEKELINSLQKTHLIYGAQLLFEGFYREMVKRIHLTLDII